MRSRTPQRPRCRRLCASRPSHARSRQPCSSRRSPPTRLATGTASIPRRARKHPPAHECAASTRIKRGAPRAGCHAHLVHARSTRLDFDHLCAKPSVERQPRKRIRADAIEHDAARAAFMSFFPDERMCSSRPRQSGRTTCCASAVFDIGASFGSGAADPSSAAVLVGPCSSTAINSLLASTVCWSTGRGFAASSSFGASDTF